MASRMPWGRPRRVGMVVAVVALCVGCLEAPPEKLRAARRDASQAVGTADPKGKKVLLVSSYHQGYEWTDAVVEGVRDGLDGSGVELAVHYMDTKRRSDKASMTAAGEAVGRKVAEWRPDLVIASDDDAQRYFAVKHLDTDLPIVFCGVNARRAQYGYPASNVTGILERPFFTKTIRLAEQLRPIKRLVVLSNNDATSEGVFQFMKEQPIECPTEFHLVDTFDEWKKVVLGCDRSGDMLAVYTYHTLKDKDGSANVAPREVMKWTAANSKVPTLGFLEFGIRDGLLMGIVESGQEHGRKAAEYAVEILRGVPIRALPIRKADIGVKMLNLDTAKRLELRLPAALTRGAKLVPEP